MRYIIHTRHHHGMFGDYIVCVKNTPPRGFVTIFPKRLGIFQPNFTRLLCVPIYARLRIFLFNYLQL